MSVRGKVAVELSLIAGLTAIFLLVFPRRNMLVDVGLAAFALLGVTLSAKYTRQTVWAASPSPVEKDRTRRGVAVVCGVTVPTALLFLLFGGMVAYRQGGWPDVASRVFNWRMLAVFGCYLPWALMQQTLLEFYFLGRLLVLLPKQYHSVPMILTGCCFGLVHLPDWPTASVTIAAGMVWSVIYYRYRTLLPLAISHAALGTAFYYGIMGKDLATEWKGLLH
jgi:membrane protease YdiL (CAAX protease family)